MEESSKIKKARNFKLNYEYVQDVPKDYILHADIRKFLGYVKNSEIIDDELKKIEKSGITEIFNSNKEWSVLMDGSAYSGQWEREGELKQGFGKYIDCYGNYCIGHFWNNIFKRGVIFAPRPFRIIISKDEDRDFIDEEFNFEAKLRFCQNLLYILILSIQQILYLLIVVL